MVDDVLFYNANNNITNTPMDIELNTPKENKNIILFISNLRLGKTNESE